ncbi:MAG: aminoglycoside 6-adenylyltransferase [Chloroflexi bacterium]|nr:aminoglycoside 6-adenylyltransferase [Chloroflexota bacterium]
MIYEAIGQQVIEWAASRDDIRVVLVVGSRARAEAHPADEFSDLDLVLYTTDPTLYLSSDTLPPFTRPALHIRCDTWPNGSREYMVLLPAGDGLAKVDLAFADVDRLAQIVANGIEPPYDRGYLIWLDKDGLAARLPPPVTAKPFQALPTQAAFNDAVGEFFYYALATAKQIHRGNLWVAQSLDWKCKHHLLTMLEWKTLLEKPQVDVWHDGRFMHEWLDTDVWNAVPGTFGAFESDSMLRALRNTIDLFRQAAQMVAAKLRFDYPPVDAAVSAVITGM